jgi:hypothetical protein
LALSLGNIAPFGLAVGIGLHFPAYLFLRRDCIGVLAGSRCETDAGAIGILRIKFVPEPSGWEMLVAGVVLLGLFFWSSGRKGNAGHQNAEIEWA